MLELLVTSSKGSSESRGLKKGTGWSTELRAFRVEHAVRHQDSKYRKDGKEEENRRK